MATQFSHSNQALLAGNTRTLLYGPVAAGTTAIVFAGVFANVDDTNQVNHWVILETYNGTSYQTKLNRVPLPYGSSSMCPKIVLQAGESLYVTSDVANVVASSVEVALLS